MFLRIQHVAIVFFGLVGNALTERLACAKQPNVLMIAVDDLRPELACYGAEHIHSPNIDGLAASGMRFDRAYCSVAVCGASRASLLSGCRPQTTGIWDYKTPLRSKMPDVVTLPGHFAAHGYQTAFLGKVYHSSSDDHQSWTVDADDWAPTNPNRGKSWVLTPYHRRKPHPSTPKLKHGPSTENGGDVPDHAYVDGNNADRAVVMLERFATTDKPFFFAVGFLKPHLPFNAPSRYWDMYDRSEIVVPPRQEMRDGIRWAQSNWGELKNYPDIGHDNDVLDDETSRRLIHGYYAAVSYMDAQVGKVLRTLKRLDLANDTIVVLWGDHGWYVGDYGQWCKHTNYEVATRVPLVFRVPSGLGFKVQPGSTTRLAELLDIYPTLCRLAGLPIPQHLHGHSLVPLLEDPDRPWRAAAISQYVKSEPIRYRDKSGKLVQRSHSNLGTSVRTERFRFTQWRRRSDGEVRGEELVDFENDPAATANVIDELEYVEVLPKLRSLAAQSATGVAPPRQ